MVDRESAHNQTVRAFNEQIGEECADCDGCELCDPEPCWECDGCEAGGFCDVNRPAELSAYRGEDGQSTDGMLPLFSAPDRATLDAVMEAGLADGTFEDKAPGLGVVVLVEMEQMAAVDHLDRTGQRRVVRFMEIGRDLQAKVTELAGGGV